MQTPYELLGGDPGVRALADEFYRVMAQREEAADIRKMHGQDLGPVSEKLYMFLSGWLGGDNLYLKKYGTVCLSSPHARYAIGEAERDQWLACMQQALLNIGASEELQTMLREPLFNLADLMRNKD
ncbi:group II truncated hemoglobin [uncultured Neptuniibacter sp.]|uniref:group II truncated hemoglobin n=1 Tax=uncultured Neptuniibacter sp. TaxID=502143 RepID=UPI00261F8432|nr:group II truncated hemoglobin [uncultured Neptuniibacter sp.]